MAKPTILVTGGAGFIGAHTIKKLSEEGYRVIAVDNFNKYYDPNLKKMRVKYLLKNKNVLFYKYDIAEKNKLKKIFVSQKIDLICHLAAQAGVRYSLENPLVYEKSNIKGTINLLELAKEFKIKGFIFASSSSVYGDSTKIHFQESDRTDEPISLYAATKKAVELLAFTYHKLYNINCTGLRFFTVYGPWGRPDMALFKFTKNIIENKPLDIYYYGKMKRDFTYVDDIVSGVISAIKKNLQWSIINLSNNKPVKLMEMVNTLEKALGKQAKKKFLPRQKGDVIQTCGSISKAKKLLGYNPKTSLEEGIKKFVEWYLEYYKK